LPARINLDDARSGQQTDSTRTQNFACIGKSAAAGYILTAESYILCFFNTVQDKDIAWSLRVDSGVLLHHDCIRTM